jgi:lysophospholipase L1-like esterase
MLTKLSNLAGPAGKSGVIPTEAKIAEALHGPLVRAAFADVMGAELEDPTSPVAQGVSEVISDEVGAATLAQGRALWTPRKRRVGLLTECVIVGSSNAASTAWGAQFCAAWGMTERNHAVGGSGFQSSQNFLTQLEEAAADTTFDNADVALVVIADASNNIRGWNDTGFTLSLADEINAAFAFARSTFTRARVLCLPVVWPADPVAAVVGVPGGYQRAWSIGLQSIVQEIRDAALLHDVELVDQSWTWLTGLSGVMNSDGSVHPNAAGYALICRWLAKHLRGESTRRDTAWEPVQYSSAAALSGAPPLRVRFEGWTGFLNGSLKTDPFPANGGFADVALLRPGLRPPNGWEIRARENGSTATTGMQLNANGVLRVWGNIPGGTEYFISDTFTIS